MGAKLSCEQNVYCYLIVTGKEEWYEPAGRWASSTLVVGESLFLRAGYQDKAPRVHDSAEKQAFLSRVEVFHLQRGNWEQQTTSGTPPLGVWGYSCVAVDNDLHYFGGWCGHGDCYHNSVHKLSTSSLQWRVLAPTTTEVRGPMKKGLCGMVAFKDGEEAFLFVVGGLSTAKSSSRQRERALSNATWYEQPGTFTDEQHMFSLNTSEHA